MKILTYTTAYPSFIQKFYKKNVGLESKSYAEQREKLFYESFGWGDAYSGALQKLQYESTEICMNAEPLQRAWARENLSSKDANAFSLEEISLEQVKKFQPDILFYDSHDADELKRIKSTVPSIRLVLAWVGSAIHSYKALAETHLTLSCAPESVERLLKKGINAQHLNHAFDPRILNRIQPGPKTIDLTFIGQILHGREYHSIREALLVELAEVVSIKIFSPSAEITNLQKTKAFIKFIISKLTKNENQILQKINPVLKKHLFPSVYGLDMYQVLSNSRVTLNIHADSSPTHASNARLFETTGIGTCLLTDWKENLPSIFAPDYEIVTYKSSAECVEKIKWLISNPQECEKIAKAGQARTLREHTFEKRAVELDQIIKKSLK